MTRPAWSLDLSTILGLGLMTGAVVAWLIGRITLGELSIAAATAAPWVGIRQTASIAHANLTAHQPVTVNAPAVAVAATSEK